MKKYDLALVVMSCDAYEDVANVFFDLKDKYMPWWKGNCYYINEERQYKRNGVITINGGKNNGWSNRLKKSLKKIPEKYVLYMQEDYLIDKPVLEKDFVNAMEYILKNDIWYYKIDNFPKIRFMIDEIHSAIPSNIRYGINLLTAIIDKDKFIERLPIVDSDAWKVEASFLNKVTDDFEYNLEGCVLNTKPIISVLYGVRHGKWMKDVINKFRNKGYIINCNDRQTMSYIESFKIQLMHFISHSLSTKHIRIIKKILIKFNFKFVSDDK